jgi:hypothetical protein
MRDTGIADRLRRAGLRVIEVAGWQTAGSESFDPAGSVNHHTAGPSSGATPSLVTCIEGRPDLPGPLCNVYQSREPAEDIAYVIASGRANHAGEGGWRGLSGNASVYGLEIEHTGTGPVPEPRLQLAARIHAAMFPGDPGYVCQHSEWTGRKIDLATGVDADRFRSMVAAARNPTTALPEGPPMILVTQSSSGALWLIESGGPDANGDTGRRTLIPTADRDAWRKSGIPHATASDELFSNLAQARARVQ